MKHKIKLLKNYEICYVHTHLLHQALVTMDASGYTIEGILSQGTIGKDLSIVYTSRLFNKTEQNYSTIEKELLAIVYSNFSDHIFTVRNSN